MRSYRVHILGASGSGTSPRSAKPAHTSSNWITSTPTIFFWMLTNPQFQTVRPREERQRLLECALANSSSWILSGHLCGWGDIFVPQFQLVVFLSVVASGDSP